jgi:predicted  nucleic acid-binding Zn-ribbon protein
MAQYTGCCVYCGQTQLVVAGEDLTEDEINKLATLQCNCDEAQALQKVEQKKTYAEAKKEKKKVEEQNEKLLRELDETQELLKNTRDNLIAGQKELLKAKKDAYEWQKAADGLAEKLEELKAQGAW